MNPEKRKKEIHEDFLALRRKLQREGLFDVSTARWAGEVALHAALFASSYLLSGRFPVTAFALATVAAIHLVWWIHDCGHDAIVGNKRLSKALIETLGVLFLGMPQIEYHYGIHRRHHGFTNVLGKDTALETGPVIWHPLMAREGHQRFVPFQCLFWLLFVLPLTYPLITFRCLQISWEKGNYGGIAFWVARWVVFIGLFHLSPVLLIVPVLVAGFVLGLSASLNHFSMPISRSFELPYPGSVFLVTQNIQADSRFATWLTGGLNFHIEHHLFPTMPSWNYRKARPEVRAFARRHGLPYHSETTVESLRRLVRTLRNPLRTGWKKELI